MGTAFIENELRAFQIGGYQVNMWQDQGKVVVAPVNHPRFRSDSCDMPYASFISSLIQAAVGYDAFGMVQDRGSNIEISALPNANTHRDGRDLKQVAEEVSAALEDASKRFGTKMSLRRHLGADERPKLDVALEAVAQHFTGKAKELGAHPKVLQALVVERIPMDKRMMLVTAFKPNTTRPDASAAQDQAVQSLATHFAQKAKGLGAEPAVVTALETDKLTDALCAQLTAACTPKPIERF